MKNVYALNFNVIGVSFLHSKITDLFSWLNLMKMSNNSCDWQLSLKVQRTGLSISTLLSLFWSYNIFVALSCLHPLQLITHEATDRFSWNGKNMKYNPIIVLFYFHTINMAAMKISASGSTSLKHMKLFKTFCKTTWQPKEINI